MGKPPNTPVDDSLEKSRKLVDEMIAALERSRLLLDRPIPATPRFKSEKKD